MPAFAAERVLLLNAVLQQSISISCQTGARQQTAANLQQ